MHKYLYALCAALLCLAAPAQAQTLELFNRDTLVTSEPQPLDPAFGYCKIRNIGSNTARVIVRRTIESAPANQQFYFCFTVSCYSPFTDESTDTLTLPAGGVDSSFKAYINPMGELGQANVRYEFIDLNTNSRTSIRFRYSTVLVSVKERAALQALVASAMPARGTLTLAPNAGLRLTLADMAGRQVRTFLAGATPTPADLTGLMPGAYVLQAADGRRCRIVVE